MPDAGDEMRIEDGGPAWRTVRPLDHGGSARRLDRAVLSRRSDRR